MKRGMDKILVDAPCSGTGTLRRNPDAKWKLCEEAFGTFQKDQVRIIENTLSFLKKGGKLSYVTCSIEPCENDEAIVQVLTRHPESHKIGIPGSSDGFFRLVPHRDGTGGFFMVVLESEPEEMKT